MSTITTTAEYERTVHAAVNETHSKFSLGEALALDIAPRRGRPAHGETSTDRQLSEAREEIVEAGGEPRAVATLRNYRLTALWVKHPKSGDFRWIDGRCWSVHDEARQRGMSYAEFAAMTNVRVELIREATRDLAPLEPAPATQVTFRPPVLQEEQEPVRWRHPQVPPLPEPRPAAPQPEQLPEPAPTLPVRPRVPRPRPAGLSLVTALSAVHHGVERIAREIAEHGIPADQRAKVLTEVAWLISALTRIDEQAAATA
jgi:hypothetical protein